MPASGFVFSSMVSQKKKRLHLGKRETGVLLPQSPLKRVKVSVSKTREAWVSFPRSLDSGQNAASSQLPYAGLQHLTRKRT